MKPVSTVCTVAAAVIISYPKTCDCTSPPTGFVRRLVTPLQGMTGGQNRNRKICDTIYHMVNPFFVAELFSHESMTHCYFYHSKQRLEKSNFKVQCGDRGVEISVTCI